MSILSLESKHIISSNNNYADFNNLIIIVSVGYLLRVGFEPTYSPYKWGRSYLLNYRNIFALSGETIMKCSACVEQWDLRLDLNQQPIGYEPIALAN